MIELGIKNLLSTITTYQAYPVTLAPAATYPCCSYQFVGGNSQSSFETSGLIRMRVQVDCWGVSYGDAVTLRADLIGGLNGYQGQLSDGTYLQDAEFIQVLDFFEPDAGDNGLYRAGFEMYLHFCATN